MCVPLNWESKPIRRVVRSSLAAEALALADALDDAVYLMNFFPKLCLTITIKYQLK